MPFQIYNVLDAAAEKIVEAAVKVVSNPGVWGNRTVIFSK